MKVYIEDAVRDGFARTATATGAIFVVAFIAINLGQAVALNSLVGRLLTVTVDLSEYFANVDQMTYEEFVQTVESAPLYLLDAPATVLFGLLVAVWLVGIVVKIGAIRWFVEERQAGLRVGLFTRRLLWTIGNLIVGLILFGLVVFVVPVVIFSFASAFGDLLTLTVGIAMLVAASYLGVALFFYNIDIVVEGSNAIDALATSWELTKGNRLPLFMVGAAFLIGGEVLRQVVGELTGPGLLLTTVVIQVVLGVLSVFSIGVAAHLYTQLRDGESANVSAAGPDEL